MDGEGEHEGESVPLPRLRPPSESNAHAIYEQHNSRAVVYHSKTFGGVAEGHGCSTVLKTTRARMPGQSVAIDHSPALLVKSHF